MPYVPHYLVQFGGRNVSASTEIWECTLRCDTNELAVDEEAYLDAMAPRLMTWWRVGTGRSADTAFLDFVKFNRISPNGHYTDTTTTHQHNYTGTVNGTKTPTVPAFMSLCYSWMTPAARGRASKGRIYLPNYTAGVAGFKVDTVTPHLAWAHGLIDAVTGNDGAGNEVVPAVFSKLVDAKHNFITGVRIGDVWDVQRRRKNAIAETYESLTF